MNLSRLSSLCGIGLMLTGALGYALPEVQDLVALLPALCGLVMATAGMASSNEAMDETQSLLGVNAAIAIVLTLYVFFKLGTDRALKTSGEHLCGDLALLGFSVAWLIAWSRRGHSKSRSVLKV